MPSRQENQSANISWGERFMGQAFSTALSIPLHREMNYLTDEFGVTGLDRAKEAARDGMGTVILFSHADTSGPFVVAKDIVVGNKEFATKPSVFVTARHQKNLLFTLFEKTTGFEYPYIVTENTLSRDKYKEMGMNLNDGVPQFLDRSGQVLNLGGTVAIAFQGGRSDWLNVNDGPSTIGTFVAQMQRRNISNFGFLFVGVTEKDRYHYDLNESGGFRAFKTEEVRVGMYRTLQELLEEPEIALDQHGDPLPRARRNKNIDPFVRKRFVPLVREEYLHAPNDQSMEAQRLADELKKAEFIKNGAKAVIYAGAALAGSGAI